MLSPRNPHKREQGQPMKTIKLLRAGALIPLALAAMTSMARADFISVPVGSQTNADIRTYTGGANYPIAPTNISVAGVPFQLVTLQGTANTLGVIQTPGVDSSFTIVTNISRATTVYTLMNSAFGQSGADIGTIEFKGQNSTNDVTFHIVEGDNIRDHFAGGFNNSATNIVSDPFLGGVQDPNGPDRLDMQTFVLPSGFASDTLTSIIFSGTRDGNPQGEAFLAAATAQTLDAEAPEPSSLTLLGIGAVGFAGYGLWRRYRVRLAM
jgi:hypothetical protein